MGTAPSSGRWGRTGVSACVASSRLGREPGTGTGAMLGRAQRDTPSLWSGIGDRFNAADLDAAKQALTVYCGPIATVLVRNAARYAQSLPQLYDALAAHIDSVADRK